MSRLQPPNRFAPSTRMLLEILLGLVGAIYISLATAIFVTAASLPSRSDVMSGGDNARADAVRELEFISTLAAPLAVSAALVALIAFFLMAMAKPTEHPDTFARVLARGVVGALVAAAVGAAPVVWMLNQVRAGLGEG